MIADLKPYAEYRDSGLPWLGQVPGHWETRPAFGAFVPNHERNQGMKERTVLSLSYGRIVIKPAEKLHGLVPESFETYQIVHPGDIVLRTTDLQNDHTSLRVGIVRDRGIITSAYLALRTSAGVNPEFGFQFLNVWDSSKAIYEYGSGLRQSLDFSHFKRMPVAVPPPDEQAAIVKFLDWANGRLERAIRAKRKAITLLNEQKQAIIHRAVTRGLDPTVTLKPTGIPWLGDIPQHWRALPVRALFTEVIERGHGNEQMLSVTIKRGVITQAELLDNSIKRDSSNEDKSKYKLLTPGDIAYNKMRAWQGAFGVSGQRGIISPAYIVVRPTDISDSRYYHFLFRTPTFATVAESRSYGIASDMWSLRSEHFRLISVPAPPIEEQSLIAEHLNTELAAFNTSISRLEREIELLREYRTRLIADVVTGKLDVREAAARLPEEEPLGTVEDAADLDEDLDIADGEATV
jgi:type I restriction enzyme S subunit